MGFEPVSVRAAGGGFNPLEAGRTSVTQTGVALFFLDDLALVNISDQCAILADAGTLRVALRRPRGSEDAGSIARVVAVRRRGHPVRGKVQVQLAPAIRQLGLTLRAVGGARIELSVKDDLLIVNLASDGMGKPGRARRADDDGRH